MTTQKITATLAASALLVLPIIVRAHCDTENSDGGCGLAMNPDGSHKAGASALLSPSDPRWWYLLAVSLVLMSALSRIVWKYLQVNPPQKPPTVKPEEKK